MFEEEEDEDNYKMSELEKWYDNNFAYFNRASKPEPGLDLDITLFYNNTYCPVMKELAPAVRKLMYKQYPLLETKFRPMVMDHINWMVSKAGHRLLLMLNILVQDQKEGVNLREKYPDFESWIDFYARPPEPPVPDYHSLDNNPLLFNALTAEQIKEIADEEWESNIKHFNKVEELKKEYYDLIQPLVLKYYPALQDLDYDGWIIYAVEIREEYEDYKLRCEHVDSFIEYGMDEEDIHLTYKEFYKKFSLKFHEKWERDHPTTEPDK
jgi:hypothetical protein